jgi:hypothetical protein
MMINMGRVMWLVGFTGVIGVLMVAPFILAQTAVGTTSSTTTVGGTVAAISGNTLAVTDNRGEWIITVGSDTRIWKRKLFHDLSAVRIGDRITARCRVVPGTGLTAEAIWLNTVNIFGNILKLTRQGIEVMANPNADPRSAYRSEKLDIQVDEDTRFETSQPTDLRIGRNVQVVGVDLGGSKVAASKIIVYEGNRPTGMSAGATTVTPNGTVLKK